LPLNVSKMDDNKLLRLFHNVIDHLEKGHKIDQALDLLNQIECEWKKRLENYLMGDEKATRPDQGMLKTIGYRVGNDGIIYTKRRLILDRIINGVLPFCGSPSYMAEWGNPKTKKRFRKLRDVLNQLIFKNKKFSDMEVAVSDWVEDLKYIKGRWHAEIYKIDDKKN
jgi:hypothetical protein